MVKIEGRGVQQIERVSSDSIQLDTGLVLCRNSAMEQGAAVALDTGRRYGSLEGSQWEGRQPFWRSRGQRTWWQGVLNALVGNRRVFPNREVDVNRLELVVPKDLSRPTNESRLFTAELGFAAYSTSIERVCRELEERGFKDVRVVSRDDALALVAVDPSESGVYCVFRCATKVHTTLLGVEKRTVATEHGEVPRGIASYVEHIGQPVDQAVSELLEKYPTSKLVVTGSSLGAGAGLNWLSSRLADGTVDESQVAQVVLHGPTQGVGKARAKELHALLGERLDVCVAKGDRLFQARNEHGNKITPIGTQAVSTKQAHSLGYSISALKLQSPFKVATEAEG
ncbi:MAG: hypothetical protein AAFY60_21160, partial [Myxococcota bacterium]